jgi:flagellar protein FliO/FliZ
MRHFALLLLCLACLGAAEPAAPNAPDTVIFPRAPGEKATAAGDRDGWSRAPWLVGALALAAAGTWWLVRSRAHAGPGSRAGRRLVIEETRSLGNRQYLIVAAYEEKKLLLGVTPGRIKLLCDLSTDEETVP